MTLPRWETICAHWEKTPPLAVTAWVIAQGLGAKREAPKTRESKVSQAQELMELLGGAGSGFSQRKPEWLTTT